MSASAGAQPDPKAEAARHFRRGVELYEEEAYDGAIAEFRRAYDTKPEYRVLYNLGQAYVAAGRPVDAVDALTRYLRDGGAGIAGPRRTQVQDQIARQQARIGSLVLQVTPGGALVKLDGAEIGTSPLGDPVRVTVGRHVVSAFLEGYHPAEQALEIAGEEHKSVEIALTPVAQPIAPSQRAVAQIAVLCAVPAVQVLADGRLLGETPLAAPLLVPAGRHAVRFVRAGYRTREVVAAASEDSVAQVGCDLEIEPHLDPMTAGHLELVISEPGARVWVDGVEGRPNTTLPTGIHEVRVERYGFVPYSSHVRVSPGDASRVSVSLVPTPEYLRDYRASTENRRTWSYVFGASGVAVLGTAAGVWIWNNGRYSDWKSRHSALEDAYAGEPPYPPELVDRQKEANRLLASVHSVDVVTAALGVGAGALLAAGAILYLGGDSPDRYGSGSAPRVRIGLGAVGPCLAW